MATLADVERAVIAQYDGGPQQRAAIAWLLAVFEQPAGADAAASPAWRVLPALLHSRDVRVRFYAANGLYASVRRGWPALPPPHRAEVEAALW